MSYHDDTLTGIPEFPTSELVFKRCCDRKQITCFRKVSQSDIDNVRSGFYSLDNETTRNQFVLDYFRTHSRNDKTILFSVVGQVICETCWRLVYGIRYHKFKSLLSKFENGVLVAEHGLLGSSNTSASTIRMTSWMRSFFSKVGDRMPMSTDVHLPSCLTKADVYEPAGDDLTQGGLQCCSASQFYAIWNSNFNHVKIPKVYILSMIRARPILHLHVGK